MTAHDNGRANGGAAGLNVAIIQMNSQDDKSANIAAALDLIDRAAATGARLVALPEVWPYLIDLRGISVAAPSPESLAGTLVGLARDPKPVPDELDSETRQTLVLWTGNDDGHAAARTRDAICVATSE